METPKVAAWPLAWPEGWRRTLPGDRKVARFKVGDSKITVEVARRRLMDQLKLLRVHSEILSTNTVLRLDGQPRSGQPEPEDPGAALYFVHGGQGRAIACDRWKRTADNICALAYHLNALRSIDRYGVGSIHQAFAGYAPRLQSSPLEWWLVLNIGRFNSTRLDIDRQFTKLAKRYHPDAPGGSAHEMSRLSEAKTAAYRDILE